MAVIIGQSYNYTDNFTRPVIFTFMNMTKQHTGIITIATIVHWDYDVIMICIKYLKVQVVVVDLVNYVSVVYQSWFDIVFNSLLANIVCIYQIQIYRLQTADSNFCRLHTFLSCADSSQNFVICRQQIQIYPNHTRPILHWNRSDCIQAYICTCLQASGSWSSLWYKMSCSMHLPFIRRVVRR